MEGIQKAKERAYSEEEKQSRKEFLLYLKSVKEKVENGDFDPSEDWGVIWVLSGPEYTFTEEDAENAEDAQINQTKERIEKGFGLLKEVTALRAGKIIKELNEKDYRSYAPMFYYNGGEERGKAFKKMIDEGIIEKRYGIPSSVIQISKNDASIFHTGHQFDEFPNELLNNGKVIVVSSWYHTPRVQEYVKQKDSQMPDKNLSEQMLVYPANLDRLRIGRAVGEAKKVWDYFQKDTENI